MAGWRRQSAPFVQHPRVAGGGPDHIDGAGSLSARPGPARPGRPGRVRPDLRQVLEITARPGRPPRHRRLGISGAGPGRLPAERARHFSPGCHRGHRLSAGSPTSRRWHRPAAGRRPGHAGMDPQATAIRRAVAAISEAMQAARARPACSIQSRRSGPAAAGPGRPTSPPDGREGRASARTTSQTTPGSRGIWCWPGSFWPRPGPPGGGAAGPAARGGGAQGRDGA